MKIAPIIKTKISDQVFEQMKQLILRGEWKSGEKLPSENHLADEFAVSRVTIRHALQKLTVLGLIETILGEGSFVREAHLGMSFNPMIPIAYLQKRNVLEVLDFRYLIEIETAALAVQRASDQDINTLKGLLKEMEAQKSNTRNFADTDLRFHFQIGLITGNSLVIGIYNILKDILSVSMEEIVSDLGSQLGLHYHRRLIKAFENRDSEQAKSIMREHMDSTRETFKKITQSKN
jgi:GntR family transcriptional repressor for pyruvate dehydrogenase complex